MKLFIVKTLVLVTTVFCFGQNSENSEFAGFLTTSDGYRVTFKLIIDQLDEGPFTGYSETDYDGENYTKSSVKGAISLERNELSFKEIGNTETKSTAEDSTFCYITASDLTLRSNDKADVIVGTFEGFYPSGKTCATGAVLLVNNKNIKEKKKEKKRKKEIKKPKKNNTTKEYSASKPSNADSIFTSNEELIINKWGNDGIVMEVWDSGIQDSDLIAIYLNDKIIEEKIFLTNEKTIIKLPTGSDSFKLKIVALNEGHVGINTFHFRLKNVGNNKDYISELRKGESFVIDFK